MSISLTCLLSTFVTSDQSSFPASIRDSMALKTGKGTCQPCILCRAGLCLFCRHWLLGLFCMIRCILLIIPYSMFRYLLKKVKTKLHMEKRLFPRPEKGALIERPLESTRISGVGFQPGKSFRIQQVMRTHERTDKLR